MPSFSLLRDTVFDHCQSISSPHGFTLDRSAKLRISRVKPAGTVSSQHLFPGQSLKEFEGTGVEAHAVWPWWFQTPYFENQSIHDA